MARLPRRTIGESSSRSSVSMEEVEVTYGCIASFTVKASPFNAAGVQRRADGDGDGEATSWVSRSEEADIMGGFGRDFPCC